MRAGLAAEFGDRSGALPGSGSGDPATELRRIVEALTDVAGLPEAAKAVMGEAWDDGYGILADLFVPYGDDHETATMHAVAALGSLYHYIA